jgi:hypothetical protein
MKIPISNQTNIESKDLIGKSFFQSLFIQKFFKTIPPLCILCQKPTNSSQFNLCRHSPYCSSCFKSQTQEQENSGICCPLCGIDSYTMLDEIIFDISFVDSDFLCNCCHSRQIISSCHNLGCKHCYNPFHSMSLFCMFCSKPCVKRYLTSLQMMPRHQISTLKS